MSKLSTVAVPPRAIVIGATGGIGAALVRNFEMRGFEVAALSRSHAATSLPRTQCIDLTSEASIRSAASSLAASAPYTHVLVATGLLHAREFGPEKALRNLDQANLAKLFAVNAIGPALVAKYFVPLLPRHDRSIFAVLSARVGSISDNRLGGWYGYRASKAALNMFIKTLAIELARVRPQSICAALHPGTVETGLSKPFQVSVAGATLFSPDQAAMKLVEVIDQLTPEQSGRCFGWDGAEISP